MINDHNGLYLDFSNDHRDDFIDVWDNGDLPKIQVIDLAKSTKFLESLLLVGTFFALKTDK